MSIATLLTAEELLRMPDSASGYELIAGELRKMSPANRTHCIVAGRLASLLGQHVLQHKPGEILVAEPGFVLARDPDTVRVPDIAFLRREHLRGAGSEEVFSTGSPDLAVEVLSPGDRPKEVAAKARIWLDAGAAMVWVVNPARRTVTVYRTSTDVKTLTEKDDLDGGEVLPGFRCRVSEIFENL